VNEGYLTAMRATAAAGASPATATAAGLASVVMDAPAVTSTGYIGLAWTEPLLGLASSYTLQFRASGTSLFSSCTQGVGPSAVAPQLGYLGANLISSGSYDVVVVANLAGAAGALSTPLVSTIPVTVGSPPTAAPSALLVSNVGLTSATLTWLNSAAGSPVATSAYLQWRVTGSGPGWQGFAYTPAGAATYTVVGLASSTSYDFQVAGVANGAPGPFTATVTATPGPGYDVLVLGGASNAIGLDFAGLAAAGGFPHTPAEATTGMVDAYGNAVLLWGPDLAGDTQYNSSQSLGLNAQTLSVAVASYSTVGASNWRQDSLSTTVVSLSSAMSSVTGPLYGFLANANGGNGGATDSGPSLAYTFAQMYANNVLARGRQLVVVAAAAAGTGVTGQASNKPLWQYDAALYLRMVNATRAVMGLSTATASSAAANRVVGLLWHQGEADLADPSGSYLPALSTVVGGFRADAKAPGVPVVMGHFVPTYVLGADDGNQSLLKNSRCIEAYPSTCADARARVASSHGLHTGGYAAGVLSSSEAAVTFSARANRAYGQRYFNAFLDAAGLSTSDVTATALDQGAALPYIANGAINDATGVLSFTTGSSSWRHAANAAAYAVQIDGVDSSLYLLLTEYCYRVTSTAFTVGFPYVPGNLGGSTLTLSTANSTFGALHTASYSVITASLSFSTTSGALSTLFMAPDTLYVNLSAPLATTGGVWSDGGLTVSITPLRVDPSLTNPLSTALYSWSYGPTSS
jgi:hypothetical protein